MDLRPGAPELVREKRQGRCERLRPVLREKRFLQQSAYVSGRLQDTADNMRKEGSRADWQSLRFTHQGLKAREAVRVGNMGAYCHKLHGVIDHIEHHHRRALT